MEVTEQVDPRFEGGLVEAFTWLATLVRNDLEGLNSVEDWLFGLETAFDELGSDQRIVEYDQLLVSNWELSGYDAKLA